jgi:hypothetical protein
MAKNYVSNTDANVDVIVDSATQAVVGLRNRKTGDESYFPRVTASGDLVDQDGGLIYSANNGSIPNYTPFSSLRHVSGDSCYPISKQGGSQQAISRHWVPIYADIEAGDTVQFSIKKTGDYQESFNLNGATWQIGMEHPLTKGTLTPCYWDTGLLTKTFGPDKNTEYLTFTAPHAIRRGSFISFWIWAKNGFGMNISGDIAYRNQTGAASTFNGDLFRRDSNSTNYNNNTLALFTEGGITGMSDATRNALTNDFTSTFANTVDYYWHIGIHSVQAVSNIPAIASIGDSTDARGGSQFSISSDNSKTYGVAGKALGRKFPVMNLSGANGRFAYWVDNPANSAIRAEDLQWCTHVAFTSGINDCNDFGANGTGYVAKAIEFMNLPIFEGKGWIGFTIAPFSTSTTVSSDFMTTLANSFTSTHVSRNYHNDFIMNSGRFDAVYDINTIVESPVQLGKYRIPSNARTVVGSMSSGSNLLTLDSGYYFRASDNRLRVGNSNLGGTGTARVAEIVVTGPQTATLVARTAGVAITSENFYIGACQFNQAPNDYLHKSPAHYDAYYQFDVKGVFEEGFIIQRISV